jgi:hypothetical protein
MADVGGRDHQRHGFRFPLFHGVESIEALNKQ